jgi:hypothetical protein
VSRRVSSRRDPFGDVVDLTLIGRGWIEVRRQRVPGSRDHGYVSPAKARDIAAMWLRAAQRAEATKDQPVRRRSPR